MVNGEDRRDGASERLERRLAQGEGRSRVVEALKEAVQSMPDDETTTPGAEQAPERQADEMRRKAEEYDEVHNRMLRALADLDNLQKRFRREVDQARRQGADALLQALLPVFDNLELSLSAADTARDPDAVVAGIRMILDQFRSVLAERGIRRTGEVGERFDPNLHEAIGTVETAEQEPGTIVAVVRPGYVVGDRVVRHAQVQVARRPAETSDQGA